MTAHSVNDAREEALRAERDEALAEVERLRTRTTICRRCGDTITPGTMNARGVLHTAEGVECGVCVDTSGDAEPDADAMTPDAERSFRLYAAGLDMPGGTIRRVGQVIARDLLREIDRLRGEVLAHVAEADEQIRLRDEARAQLADIRRLWDAVVDAAIDALPDGGGLVSGVAEAARQLGVMRRERDDARAQLAALREAVERALLCGALRLVDTPEEAAAARALETATYDTAPAAEAHDRRVRAEALRLAADRLSAQPATAGLLREWADEIEIERGER